ncbi:MULTISPECIES: LysM peptidoglycan-binding domain-containing protein [unclassified Microbacterium]|uniref:LysM peptidoglycan-binding domain-containing protein n=1 Tax=unclassified Microbacterium TaxID=2609290 RepID=UPI000EAA8D64|nr:MULTISPECIES: LysM peptidoglycan-binding domain-containing protein [unclassified Microbacterium]MBT2486706.1 LysM peptidoglycan-binding domain-containing protein [Microbacterium sp. ISL-108]RKN64642.1 LysM peptidoglycan-binding domain-containing protein [Microbacterium sp. CGR2]
MSSITFSNAAVVHAPSATRIRLTARGRGVLLALAAVPLAVGIAFAAISGGSAIASGGDASAVSGSSADFVTVTVMPGDTLWSIASSIAPAADPRDVIGEITRLNLLPTGQLQIGQELAIPAQYSS